MNPIAGAFKDGNIGMMGQAVQEGGDAGGVGKDVVPIGEAAIGGEENRAVFIPPVDDFVEQIGGMIVVRQIPTLVNTQECGACIGFEFKAEPMWGIALEII